MENLTQHPDLIVERMTNGWALVRLNRPKSLHALDESLAKALTDVFEALQHDPEVKAIWLDSSTPKAFCAGGDVRKLRQLIINNEVETAHQFFAEEYKLDLLLHRYAKPVVVWGEGYVMVVEWVCLWQLRFDWLHRIHVLPCLKLILAYILMLVLPDSWQNVVLLVYF